MDRRSFLRTLCLGAAAVVAPTKTYAFFGNILRPTPTVIAPTFRIEVSDDQYTWREWVGAAESVIVRYSRIPELASGESYLDVGPHRQSTIQARLNGRLPQERYLRVVAVGNGFSFNT